MTLRKNILTSWVGHVVIMVLGFFMLPFVLGALGKSAYGVWLFINALAGYSSLLYMGFGATVCRYVAKHAHREEWTDLNNVVSAVFGVYSAMAGVVLLASAGLAAVAPWLDRWGTQSLGEVQLAILLNGVSTAFGMVTSVYGGVLIGTQRIDLKQSIETGAALIRFALVFALLLWRPSLTTLSLIFLAVTIAENALLVHFAYRQLPTLSVRLSNVQRSVLRDCFGFTAFSALALIAEHLMYMTDTVVIGLCLGVEAVVPYAIALRICQMAQTPLSKIGEAMLPKAGELHATGKRQELVETAERMLGLAFVLITAAFIGCWFFAPMLVDIWVARKDPSWAPADTQTCLAVLSILLGAQIVAQPATVLRKTLLGIGNVRYPAFIDLGAALVNLGLSLALVFSVGVVGVAWGTFVPLVLFELFLLTPYANREVGTSWSRLFRHGLLPQVPALAALLTYCCVVASFHPSHGWPQLLSIAAGGGAVLGATWWLTRSRLRRPAQRGTSSHPPSSTASVPSVGPLTTGSLSP